METAFLVLGGKWTYLTCPRIPRPGSRHRSVAALEGGDDVPAAVPLPLQVETVRNEIAWDNFALLDFLAKHGFTPSQRLVLTKWVE